MTPAVTLVSAGTMWRCDRTGDIDPTDGGASGLFVADVRVLSRFELTVNGHRCVATADDTAVDRLAVVLTPALARGETSDIVVERRQTIGSRGLADLLDIHNVTTRPTSVVLTFELASDFADPFMLRSDRRSFDRSAGLYQSRIDGPTASARVFFGYERHLGKRHFAAAATVEVSGAPTIELVGGGPDHIPGARIRWTLDLLAGESRSLSIDVRSGSARPVAPLRPAPRLDLMPRLAELRRQAIADVSALRMPGPATPESEPALSGFTVIAAGAPWFLTLFGRDSMLTSLLAEPDLPGLADDNLLALIATQATTTDRSRIAQPGKILHELRNSELATLGEVPYGRYYGSVDSTPLFLCTLATVGSVEVQRAGELAARAAVGWMRGPGGLDATGFLRYVSDPNGLVTQGWKDSPDSVAHSDGTIATGAIALCEVQGYAWRALNDTATLARTVWGDPAWAAELESVAVCLRDRFRSQFWIPGREFPALAIDGDNERVEVVASNAGHLLFSHMLTDQEAARVAARLLEQDMSSGWGIRTLSTSEVRFNPLSYHNGSVWPHDTMLAAVGMASYGMHKEAGTLSSAVVDAAAHFNNRPTELFGGFDRARFSTPIAYSHAAVPQAWASAAVLAAVRVLAHATPARRESE